MSRFLVPDGLRGDGLRLDTTTPFEGTKRVEARELLFGDGDTLSFAELTEQVSRDVRVERHVMEIECVLECTGGDGSFDLG